MIEVERSVSFTTIQSTCLFTEGGRFFFVKQQPQTEYWEKYTVAPTIVTESPGAVLKNYNLSLPKK